jgi:hypothetical protein
MRQVGAPTVSCWICRPFRRLVAFGSAIVRFILLCRLEPVRGVGTTDRKCISIGVITAEAGLKITDFGADTRTP